MATKLTLTDLSSTINTVTIQANFTSIEDEFDKCLYRDGTSPNQMEDDLDMNSNEVVNLGAPASNSSAARLQDIVDASDVTTSTGTLTSISDSGGYYTSDHVEGALQEIGPQRTRVELGNDFTAGEDITIERIGNTVTLVSDSIADHTSASFPTSTVGVVPATFRPSFNQHTVYAMDASGCRMVEVSSTGTVSLSYRDWTGATFLDTDTDEAFSISYVIDSEIS